MQPLVPGMRHALDSRYVGPFKILQLHDSSAEIGSLHDSNPVRAYIHLDQLKPFVPRNPVLAPDLDDALDLVLRGQYGAIAQVEEEEQEDEATQEAQEEGDRQQEHDQGDFDPDEEGEMTPSKEQVSVDESTHDAEHWVIMREPRDEVMEQETISLPDEDIEMAEDVAMEEEDPSTSRRPRKRSSKSREPQSKRSWSSESYLCEEEDSD